MRHRILLALLVIACLAVHGCGQSSSTLAPVSTAAPPASTPTAMPATTTPLPPTAPPASADTPPPAEVPSQAPAAAGEIAFYSERDGNAEIYVVNADDTGWRRLTDDPAEDVCPDWSPDGTQLVFITARHDPNPTGCFRDCSYEIYVMNADGSNPRRLTDTPANELHPVWSPDGSQIAFASARDGNNEIYVMDSDGSNARRLTDTEAGEMHPTWSPDGSRIAFNSDRDGNWEIYVIDADGSNPRRLTDSPAWDLFPDWSPDGTEIVFFTTDPGKQNQDIAVMAADGSNLRLLTDTPRTVDEDPVWSPDGAYIAFQSDRDGNFEIYAMRADGSEQRNLSKARNDEYWPSWRPPTKERPPASSPTALPTGTPLPPTSAPAPTATPLAPTATPAPATHTVCASGCDFSSIQAALNDEGTPPGAIIEVRDAIHTEAGVVVSKQVTIRGLGAAATIVQAHSELKGSPGRVFLIQKSAEVLLEKMTIRHGKPSAPSEHGGAILNEGILTVEDCVVMRNSAIGGGGISSNGVLTIIASTVSNNVARGDGPRGEECGGGGGVKASKGTLTILNSTITANQAGTGAEGLGGGVRTGCGCTAAIVNTTISGNKAARYGGGIAAGGTVTITHCTISSNTVRSQGGALWVRDRLSLVNTIIADNSTAGGDCVLGGQGGHLGKGSIETNLHSLIEDGSCGAEFSGDAMLGSLADNGGPTFTHALLPGSPAIDALPSSACPLNSDQRGAPRPVVQTSADTPCDLGAFELQSP